MFIFSDFTMVGACVARFKSIINTFSYSGYFTTVASLCILLLQFLPVSGLNNSDYKLTFFVRRYSVYQECDCTCK